MELRERLQRGNWQQARSKQVPAVSQASTFSLTSLNREIGDGPSVAEFLDRATIAGCGRSAAAILPKGCS